MQDYSIKDIHTLLSTAEVVVLKGIRMKKMNMNRYLRKLFQQDRWSSSIGCAELLTYLYLYSVMSKKRALKINSGKVIA